MVTVTVTVGVERKRTNGIAGKCIHLETSGRRQRETSNRSVRTELTAATWLCGPESPVAPARPWRWPRGNAVELALEPHHHRNAALQALFECEPDLRRDGRAGCGTPRESRTLRRQSERCAHRARRCSCPGWPPDAGHRRPGRAVRRRGAQFEHDLRHRFRAQLQAVWQVFVLHVRGGERWRAPARLPPPPKSATAMASASTFHQKLVADTAGPPTGRLHKRPAPSCEGPADGGESFLKASVRSAADSSICAGEGRSTPKWR